MNVTKLTKLLIVLIFTFTVPIFAGNVTVTLVDIDPLKINIKGNSQNEEAGNISFYLYYRDDATTSLTTGNVDVSPIETGFGWGTSFATAPVIESGSWIINSHTYTRRLFYDNADPGVPNDYWTTAGIDAIIVDFTVVGTGNAYIEVNGVDGLADYSGFGHTVTFANQEKPLPVELTSFTASNGKNGINLNWQTKTETNNYGFEIERRAGSSAIGFDKWEKIGFINGHGNSNSPIDYSFVDKNTFNSSKVHYRLKQIDTDGQFTYSEEVEIELIPAEFTLYQNYPNPFNPSTNIKFALPKDAKVTLIVYNLVGEKVVTLLDENKEAGYYNLEFNADNLSSGMYIYRLTAENFVQTKKMTLIR